MISKQYSAAIALVVLLGAAGYGVVRTGRPLPVPAGRAGRTPSIDLTDSALAIDQTSLNTAQQLVGLPTTADERPFAEDAVRIGNQEMDLAFADAVRKVASQPRAATSRARAIDARLQRAQKSLAANEAQVTELTAAVAKAGPTTKDAVNDRLELAKAQAALDHDEADDARQDLIDAGGDPQGRMQAMIQEHEAASKGSDSIRVAVTATLEATGLVRRVRFWEQLREKEAQLRLAKAAADSMGAAFAKRHDVLDDQSTRANDSTRRRDSTRARDSTRIVDSTRLRDSTRTRRSTRPVLAPVSQDTSRATTTALLRTTQQRAADEKAKTTLDQRVANQRRLSRVYGRWARLVSAQRRTVTNRILRGVAVILAIGLLGLLVDAWIEKFLSGLSMDRRRAQTLVMVTRVSLQVITVLFILLVIFGPPDNLGTFLGLAGAGLTVALRDFIIGFCGWFVLMGQNGIRIGDLVEINGVTGEVVELGMYQTVLLETSDWNDSGHPTGRRVTFTNSFAIEGHYFNFSTSGQWGWDQVSIVVPNGRNPDPIVDAIRKEVEEATADSAREAEQQWKVTRRSPNALTAAPAISIKPIIGGIEITARYIVHVGERSALKASLYQTAIGLLGDRIPSLPSPGSTPMSHSRNS